MPGGNREGQQGQWPTGAGRGADGGGGLQLDPTLSGWVHNVAGMTAMTLAVWVFLTRPGARTNRLLAAVLFLEGSAVFAAGFMAHSTEPTQAYAFQVVVLIGYNLMYVAYPLLVGSLPTRAAVWLRTRAAVWVAAVLGALMTLRLVTDSSWFIADVHEVSYAHYDASFTGAYSLIFFAFTVFLLFALGAAVHAWATSPVGSPRRRQAGWFALAFGLRDALLAITLFWFAFDPTPPAIVALGPPIALLVQAPLLAYGILVHQVLDIDLGIKVGISRTTVAALIAGTAFLGSELIEYAFGAERLWSALAIAAASAFALRPLVRLGDRVAARAMPGVEDTPGYRGRRAQEIYEAAVLDAQRDGHVSSAERAVLDGLAGNLGLSPRVVADIERRAVAG